MHRSRVVGSSARPILSSLHFALQGCFRYIKLYFRDYTGRRTTDKVTTLERRGHMRDLVSRTVYELCALILETKPTNTRRGRASLLVW